MAAKGNKNAVGNKGGTGRPSLYTPDMAKWAEKLARLGATEEEMAKALEISLTTFETYKRERPDFSEALKKGKALSDAEVADRLFQRAMGYSHPAVKIVADAKTGKEHIVEYTEHYPPDTVAAIFWLKNRQRDKWRDKVDVANTHSFEADSTEDLENRARKLAEKLGIAGPGAANIGVVSNGGATK